MRIEPVCVQNVLKLARAYAAAEGLKLATVGRYFHGTSKIFDDLEAGTVSLNVRKYDEMIAKFKAEWPKDLPWPEIREPFRARRK